MVFRCNALKLIDEQLPELGHADGVRPAAATDIDNVADLLRLSLEFIHGQFVAVENRYSVDVAVTQMTHEDELHVRSPRQGQLDFADEFGVP